MLYKLLIRLAILGCFISAIGRSARVNAPIYPALPADNIPCQFDDPFRRVVAIGDIHGDLEAFRRILRHRRLVDTHYHWSAPPGTILLLIGDLVDRGPNSRGVMDLAMQLEAEAPQKGGQAITLLGNHEAMVTEQNFKYSTKEEMAAFIAYSRTQRASTNRENRNSLISILNTMLGDSKPLMTTSEAGFGAAFTANSIYAQWFRRRNAIVRIGDVVYAHAGLGDWVFNTSLEAYNSTLRAWLRNLQGVGESPPEDTKWVIDGYDNPLWQRSQSFGEMRVRERKYQKSINQFRTPVRHLEAMLRALGARYLVIGHTVTRSKEITPAYMGRDGEFLVYRIDTGISRLYQGNLTALEQYPDGRMIMVNDIPRPSRCARSLLK